MSRSDARQLDAAVQNSLLVDQPRKIPVQIAFRHSPVPPTASVPLHGTLVSSSVAQSGNARRTASNSENNILPSSSIVSAATPRPPQLSALANSHAMLNPSSKIDPPTTFSEIQSFTDSLGRTAAALPVDSTEDNTIVEDSEGEGAEPRLSRIPLFNLESVSLTPSSTLQCLARLSAFRKSHSRRIPRQSSSNRQRLPIHDLPPRQKYNFLPPVFLLPTTSTTRPFPNPPARSNDARPPSQQRNRRPSLSKSSRAREPQLYRSRLDQTRRGVGEHQRISRMESPRLRRMNIFPNPSLLDIPPSSPSHQSRHHSLLLSDSPPFHRQQP